MPGVIDLNAAQIDWERQNMLKQAQQSEQWKNIINIINTFMQYQKRKKQQEEITGRIEAAKKAGEKVKTTYRTDEVGNLSPSYEIESPERKPFDAKALMAVMAGLQPLESVMSQEDILAMGKNIPGRQVATAMGRPVTESQTIQGVSPQSINDFMRQFYAQKAGMTPEAFSQQATRETFEFPQQKATQEAIVDRTGNVVGYRPAGSVFQPKEPQINISATDIKEAQKLVPFWERFLPGIQTEAGKNIFELRKRMIGGKLGKRVPAKQSSKYNAGDKRVINGVVYIRNEQGQWSPQR